MTYQVRVTDPDGSNSIVLNYANNITYSKTINSSNESVSFDLPASDGKSSLINNTKFWELWDVAANERVNRGPIHSITDGDGGVMKISGPGRSQFLTDHIQTDLVTFYHPIRTLFDNMRFENVAAGPSVKTYVWDGQASTKTKFFPPSMSIDEEQYMQYYGLSKQTKDNAIDDNSGYILPGAEAPSNTFYVTDSYWVGTNKYDSLVIDLGAVFTIQKASIIFPWWGGITRERNRGYAFEFDYATHTGAFEDLTSGDWVSLYENTNGHSLTISETQKLMFFFSDAPTGDDPIEKISYRTVFLGGPYITTRYFRILIKNAYAWYTPFFDDDGTIDKWSHECDPNSTDDLSAPVTSNRYPKMRGKKISDRVVEPQNDCYAGVVEFAAYVEIVERDEITPFVKQRISSDSRQITYYHAANASETITSGGYRKYEPGTFFRKAEITYSGASSSYTKFYDKDCTNCYENFNFGIMDDYNSLIYHSTSSSGSNIDINIPRNARSITMKGSSNAVVNNIDAWLGVLDPLSWKGNYAYTSTTGDYVSIKFRGASFIWWATVPSTETGAIVRIKIREKDDSTGNWSGYTTLENSFQVPNNISSEIIYEIPYGTTLVENTTYEIHIENLNGGYVSVDSFGGWWMGSLVDYNDDSETFYLKRNFTWKQIYDSRFTNGTMMKTNDKTNPLYVNFQGDRVIVYSAKGRNHGKITLVLNGTSSVDFSLVAGSNRLYIPGGDPTDGTYTVDLNTGKKGHEVPGIMIFDSDDFTGWKFGPSGSTFDALPWGKYTLGIAGPNSDTYMANFDAEDSDQFVERCGDCSPPAAGDTEINRFIYVDGISFHERASISSSWKLESHTDIIASVAEALELEWNVGENGLKVSPRIGIDSDIILQEGVNTVISAEIVKDGAKMASQLISSGADIDGLPLFSIVENRINRALLDRTVQRIQDYRSVADYFTLIGVSRAELIRRREPEYRISVAHVGYKYGLNVGDSIILKKKNGVALRARINTITLNQSKSSGIMYSLECIKWPPIV